jgi:hypothetical protein
MFRNDKARTPAFSEASIEEVEDLTSSAFEQIDEQVPLIESFRQPYPVRARGKPVMNGEVAKYG